MLGEGIVSFGVPRPTTDFRNSKCSPKMQPSSDSLPSTRRPDGVKSMSPLSLWKCTVMFCSTFCDAADLVHEIHVPRRAAELAVGDALQADVFLHLHGGADRVVLDRLQLRGAHASLLVLFACTQQLLRTQQATDVIGAERRLGETHAHSWSRSCCSSS